VKYQLRNALAIPQMNEDDPAQIPAAMHPAHEQSFFPSIGSAQLPAAMRAL
jgi:hypothetical protein